MKSSPAARKQSERVRTSINKPQEVEIMEITSESDDETPVPKTIQKPRAVKRKSRILDSEDPEATPLRANVSSRRSSNLTPPKGLPQKKAYISSYSEACPSPKEQQQFKQPVLSFEEKKKSVMILSDSEKEPLLKTSKNGQFVPTKKLVAKTKNVLEVKPIVPFNSGLRKTGTAAFRGRSIKCSVKKLPSPKKKSDETVRVMPPKRTSSQQVESDLEIEIITPLSPLQNSLLKKKRKRAKRFSAVSASPKENTDPRLRSETTTRPRPSYVAAYSQPPQDSELDAASPIAKKKRLRTVSPDPNSFISSDEAWPTSHNFRELMREELPGCTQNQLEEARYNVTIRFKEVHHEYVNSIIKPEQQKFNVFLDKTPKSKYLLPFYNEECMTFNAESKDFPVKKVESSRKCPKAKTWVHTEKNFLAPDSLRLSHFPYVEKFLTSEKDFVQKLWNSYTEGIHGGDIGCGQYISYFEMFQLLQKLDDYRKDEPLGPLTENLINLAIFTLFPNNLTYREIKQENTIALLTKRFEGIDIEMPKSFEENLMTAANTFCTKCGTLNCLTHKIKTKYEDKTFGTPYGIEFNAAPCSKRCGRNLTVDDPKWKENLPELKNVCVANLFKSTLTRQPNMCQIGRQMDTFCLASNNKTFTCYEYTQLALQESIAKVPPQLSLRNDRHQTFRKTLKNGVDNGAPVETCDHDGPCGKASTKCPCVVNRTACTFNCKCGPGCPALFPGCRCTPGSCRSKSCPCYLANWECNPLTCKECCSDLNSVSLPQDNNAVLCSNIALQNGWKKRLRVGISTVPNAGYGLFVEQDVDANELISEYTGEMISDAECERRGLIYDELFLSYTFKLVEDHHTVDAFKLGNVIRFANHKKTGKGTNCRGQIMRVNGEQRIGVYASKDIKAGDELFFDYGYTDEHMIRFKQDQRKSNH